MFKFVAYSCLLAAVALAAPSGKEVTIKVPKCTIQLEEVESKTCLPKKECDTKDVEQAVLTIAPECKDVTSKVCAPVIATIKHKREAEAFGPALGLHPGAYATIKADCREVTKQVCVNKPKKETKTVPVTSCKLTVACEPVKTKVPKRVCEEVETKVVAPAYAYLG